MKKPFLNNLIAASFLLAIVIIPSTQAALLSFDPAEQDVTVGSSLSVALVISDLGGGGTAPSVSSFDLNIRFDPTILSFTSAAFGDPALGDQLDILGLGSNPTSDVLTNSGSLNIFELSLDSPSDLDANQASSFTLATLTFDALSVGGSLLGLSINSLGDANGDRLSATLTEGNVSVVPIPGTIWLMGSALLGILKLRGRNKAIN